MIPNQTNRRRFLKGSLVGAAGLSVPMSTWARPIGANDEIRIGIIGVNGKGKAHIADFGKLKGQCRVVAVCDPDTAVLDARKAEAEKRGEKLETEQDFRKFVQREDIDAVVIATPNHLHTLIAITAMQAGKHVYVEKPVSHNIWEGRKLVEHAAKYPNLIVQHGMQRRSAKDWGVIAEFLKSGALGKPLVSRGFCYKARPSIGKVSGPQQPPATVDYSLWSGPREIMPLMRQKLHYDWHWQFAYGNGDIGNQGPHQLDVARWMIGDPDLPANVLSIGGRFGYEDDADTANTQIAFFDYKPVPIIFEVRGLPDKDMNFRGRMPNYKGIGIGNVIECEGGYIAEAKAYDKDGKSIRNFNGLDGGPHQERFLESIRSGKQAATHNPLTGHLSAGLAHMANHSYRLGQEMEAGAISDKIKDNALFAETYDRMLGHLASNKIDAATIKPVYGSMLSFDAASEKYTGELADKANALNMEGYRAEFSIPAV